MEKTIKAAPTILAVALIFCACTHAAIASDQDLLAAQKRVQNIETQIAHLKQTLTEAKATVAKSKDDIEKAVAAKRMEEEMAADKKRAKEMAESRAALGFNDISLNSPSSQNEVGKKTKNTGSRVKRQKPVARKAEKHHNVKTSDYAPAEVIPGDYTVKQTYKTDALMNADKVKLRKAAFSNFFSISKGGDFRMYFGVFETPDEAAVRAQEVKDMTGRLPEVVDRRDHQHKK